MANMDAPNTLQVQVTSPVIFSGQKLQGTVVYSPTNPVLIKKIRVRFHGYEQTVPTGKEKKHVREYDDETEALFDDIQEIYHNIDTQTPLKRGSYQWPFVFMVPTGMPPTLTRPSANIKYTITVYVDRMRQRQLITQCELLLAGVYLAAGPAPFHSGSRKFALSGQLHATVHLGSPVAYTGGQLRIGIKVFNHTKKSVNKVSVSLKNVFRLRCRGHEWAEEGKALPMTVQAVQGLPVFPHTEQDLELVVDVPHNADTSRGVSQLVRNDHFVHVRLHVGKLGDKLKIDVPIMVSTPVPEKVPEPAAVGAGDGMDDVGGAAGASGAGAGAGDVRMHTGAMHHQRAEIQRRQSELKELMDAYEMSPATLAGERQHAGPTGLARQMPAPKLADVQRQQSNNLWSRSVGKLLGKAGSAQSGGGGGGGGGSGSGGIESRSVSFREKSGRTTEVLDEDAMRASFDRLVLAETKMYEQVLEDQARVHRVVSAKGLQSARRQSTQLNIPRERFSEDKHEPVMMAAIRSDLADVFSGSAFLFSMSNDPDAEAAAAVAREKVAAATAASSASGMGGGGHGRGSRSASPLGVSVPSAHVLPAADIAAAAAAVPPSPLGSGSEVMGEGEGGISSDEEEYKRALGVPDEDGFIRDASGRVLTEDEVHALLEMEREMELEYLREKEARRKARRRARRKAKKKKQRDDDLTVQVVTDDTPLF